MSITSGGPAVTRASGGARQHRNHRFWHLIDTTRGVALLQALQVNALIQARTAAAFATLSHTFHIATRAKRTTCARENNGAH